MSLQINIEGNGSGFQQALNQAKMNAQQFANEVQTDVSKSFMSPIKGLAGTIGGFLGFEGLKSHLEGLFDSASRIKSLSEQFEVSTDSIQRWEKAVGKAHVGFNTFTQALDSLRVARQAARQGDSSMESFERLGISADKVRGGTSDLDLLSTVLGSGADRAIIAKLIGRRGLKLGAAMKFMNPNSGVMFGEDDIESLHDAELESQNLSKMGQKWSTAGGPGRSLIGFSKLLQG